MTTESEILIRAAERISVPGQWCQGWLALGASGMSHDLHGAVMWCAAGAIFLEAGEDCDTGSIFKSAHEAAGVLGFDSLGAYNDAPNRTAAECAQFLRDVAAQFEGAV